MLSLNKKTTFYFLEGSFIFKVKYNAWYIKNIILIGVLNVPNKIIKTGINSYLLLIVIAINKTEIISIVVIIQNNTLYIFLDLFFFIILNIGINKHIRPNILNTNNKITLDTLLIN